MKDVDDKLMVELTGYARTRVEDAVARLAYENLEEEARVTLRAAVEKAVDAAVVRITETAVQNAVAKVLEEGWTPTNQWGEPRGERVTLRQRIEKLLTDKHHGNYDRENNGTIAERIAAKVIAETFRTEFGKELELARQEFRKALDGAVTSKLAESLKSALGLR